MPGNVITLFMWGWQQSYRISIQSLVRNVLKELGADADAEVLLVGARCPGSREFNPVCVEPEDGKWSLSLFDGLLDSIELAYKNHRLQNMFFGDEPSMRDKPEWMRRGSVQIAVAKALETYDKSHNVTSFCGEPRRLADYYVTPVVQIPNKVFVQFPPLPEKRDREEERTYGFRSLTHAAMNVVLNEATGELQNPEPGRFTFRALRSAEEIARIAAKDFLHTPGLSIDRRYCYDDLFDRLNLVSSLMYEGTRGVGHLILTDPTSGSVDFLLEFVEPVPFREPRWVRKVLQMARTGVGIIANSEKIYGLGRLNKSHDSQAQDAFIVDFIDHYEWELRCGEHLLLRSRYGAPKLPQEPFDKVVFDASLARLFPESSAGDRDHIWNLLHVQMRQKHGSMIVVANDAAKEALRLCKQGTNIIPVRLSEELLQSASGIDGTILLDPHGICHAIGVILDGSANEECTPSRGARYNSGVRYVQSKGRRRLVIVVSEDRTVDVFPKIRKLVSRSLLEGHIANLEASTLDNYHEAMNWLDSHRFYIGVGHCERVNAALSRLDSLPKEVGLLYFKTARFEPHPEMEDSYFID